MHEARCLRVRHDCRLSRQQSSLTDEPNNGSAHLPEEVSKEIEMDSAAPRRSPL